jgi:hypothetical protein
MVVAYARVKVVGKAIVKDARILAVALTMDTVQVVRDITVLKAVVIATPNLSATAPSANRRFVAPNV